MKRIVQEESLDRIMKYWLERYNLSGDEELFDWAWYLDPVKNKVFIVLYINDTSTKTEEDEGSKSTPTTKNRI